MKTWPFDSQGIVGSNSSLVPSRGRQDLGYGKETWTINGGHLVLQDWPQGTPPL